VYEGKLKFKETELDFSNIKKPETSEVMLIVADPDKAFKLSFYPNDGVGLMRIEFIITHAIQIHPMALVKFNELKDTNMPSPGNNTELKQKEDYGNELTKKPNSNIQEVSMVSKDNRLATNNDKETEYNPIEKILGMYTYNNNAQLIGKVDEIGLKISNGKAQFSFKITSTKKETIEIVWEDIDKIGDIIILREKSFDTNTQSIKSIKNNNNTIDKNQNLKICINCKFKNDIEAIFCEECGKKILE